MEATTPRTFAGKFRQELDRQNIGVRTVARRLAGDGGNIEVIRRRLNKYLGPEKIVPTEPTRHEIETALGLERDALAPDDDEESEPDMFSALLDGLRVAMRAEVRKELRRHRADGKAVA